MNIRQINSTVYAAPQIVPEDVAEAKAMGVKLIINNRPEGEEIGQPDGAEIEAAAEAAGLHYIAIPVTHAGFSTPQVDAMRAALDENEGGKTLAFCRSGTRSTLLWALAEAKDGKDPDDIAEAAAAAGYDVAPVRMLLDAFAKAN
ncbi:TIGR01244 family sulfur transferase [Novosphingopyxis sp. YJ-S2-01]|uniref:TIGR01244 family sulfur transferase n=1 Tax=Novosphingopyxis sp. YJ-S2-01 TaxID=2794021 RepID=UPI0018DBB57A|nr:TIGR01244 family sulfur transferase [Novosphingopyxis sp. YJ-S2-01]MBH9536830.1 TIGR01244 family phosphatase [Novosphingopyxis sp. YJ-S2-01]